MQFLCFLWLQRSKGLHRDHLVHCPSVSHTFLFLTTQCVPQNTSCEIFTSLFVVPEIQSTIKGSLIVPLLSVCLSHFAFAGTICIPRNSCFMTLFSSPEPKARVSYCHSAPSVVRPSVCLSVCPSVRKLSTFSTSSPEPLDGF